MFLPRAVAPTLHGRFFSGPAYTACSFNGNGDRSMDFHALEDSDGCDSRRKQLCTDNTISQYSPLVECMAQQSPRSDSHRCSSRSTVHGVITRNSIEFLTVSVEQPMRKNNERCLKLPYEVSDRTNWHGIHGIKRHSSRSCCVPLPACAQPHTDHSMRKPCSLLYAKIRAAPFSIHSVALTTWGKCGLVPSAWRCLSSPLTCNLGLPCL